MKRIHLVAACIALFSSITSARADEASEAKLKENLKNVSRQLRDIQAEKAALQAAQAGLETKNKALEDQVKAQGKRLEEMDKDMKKAAADAKTIQEEQTAKITSLTGELAKFKTSLDKWQTSHKTVTEVAKQKEGERAKLQAKSAEQERQLAQCRRQNVELYKLANEILDRYNKFGIGEALAAREPFTGNAKVKLQNLVQDYEDKLLKQTAKP
jgi:chromosome segregation ATPase